MHAYTVLIACRCSCCMEDAPKCANRKFAMELNLLDRRDVRDAQVRA